MQDQNKSAVLDFTVPPQQLKVALVHYWLVGMRGGEKVLESLCELFPSADLYTHVFAPESISDVITRHTVRTSFIQKLPFARKLYKSYLPLMPLALEQLDLTNYDLIISSESGPAKGVIVSPNALHICYCHTPMRYLWDMYYRYLRSSGLFIRFAMPPIMHYLRTWDAVSSFRVDHFIANSTYVAARINKYYRRSAEIINPPVDTSRFVTSDTTDDYYLMAGELVNYKRPDIAVDAFNKLGRKLVVIGQGEQIEKLKAMAQSNISIMGYQSDDTLRDYYSRCKALIFPGVEDFGIVPVEAMASGRPVIAYKQGGALDSILDNKTGLFFEKQNAASLIDAVLHFERHEPEFDSAQIVNHAKQFDRAVFKNRIQQSVERLLNGNRHPTRIN